ncbi:hypothetical protein [Maribacter sp.]|uniref:hypothetical protein n=1 Tax=Maribacter sp. TaxID=1897614 RepID=UPI0025BEB5BD|nr:hypothetical protein [Maribacter sp.]
MKYRLIMFLVVIFSFISCSEVEESNFDEKEANLMTFTAVSASNNSGGGSASDEGIIAKALYVNNWKSIIDLKNSSHNDMRNSLIVALNNKSSESISFLQSKNDAELAWASLMYRFLKDAGIKTETQLAAMSFDDYRNAIISENALKTSNTIPTLQAYDNKKNLNIAYGWWLPSSNSSEISELNDATNNTKYFELKDNQNKTMDVLRIVKTGETALGTYAYLGVYHSQVTANSFQLRLAGSDDLQTWTFITSLGNRSHQGDIKKVWGGYLLVNEEDSVEGSNNIRARYYPSYTNLLSNISANNYVFPRYYSSSANGTPDIREISGASAGSSYILIGYHYYENNDVDQQGFGILKNFSDWRAWEDDIVNYNVIEMGFNGNLGGRSSYDSNGKKKVLLEAQKEKFQWQDWRLLLGDGTFYSELSISTPLGSTSFANPGIVGLGNGEFAVTSFLPTEGNQLGEIGTLLYKVQF